jgi:hypothetical protein
MCQKYIGYASKILMYKTQNVKIEFFISYKSTLRNLIQSFGNSKPLYYFNYTYLTLYCS